SFWNLVQKNRYEDDPTERRRNKKSRGDRDPIEKCMNQQPDQDRVSLMSMDELVSVSFFSEVEMRSHRVLEKVDEQVSAKDKKSGIRAAKLDALRHHFDQRRRQHETRPERDEVAQVGALPIPLDDNGAAEHIRARRRQPQQQTGQNGRHS